MQSTRVLHEPHHHHHGFPQPPPFSFDDHHHHRYSLPVSAATISTTSSSSQSLDVQDLFPPPAFDSMNFFSSNETDDMLEFLRDFDASDPWEFNPILPSSMPVYPGENLVDDQLHLYSTNHPADVDQSGIADSSSVASVHSSTGTILPPDSQTTPQGHHSPPSHSQAAPSTALHHSYSSGGLRHHPQSQASTSSATSSSPGNHHTGASNQAQADLRPKPLLSAPQKRMNHVKSEKRRRDTIRDGYLTLTKLLSPSGPGAEQLAIPRRGRPKGSGRAGTGKKTGKGKSGVLFRAVEYIRFMEEGCDSLEQECERLERLVLAVSSQQHQQQQQHQHQQHQHQQQQGYPNLQYGHSW